MCKCKIQLHIYLKKKTELQYCKVHYQSLKLRCFDVGKSGNNKKISKSKLTNNNYDKIITK